MSRPLGPVVASLLVAPLLLLSACGSDSSDGSDASSPSKPSAADVELAKSALLTARDFPKGWKAGAAADDASAGGPADPNRGATLDGCSGGGASSSANAEAASPSFTNAKDEEVSFEITVAPDEERMSADFDTVDSAAFQKCVTSAAEQGMKEGMKTEKNVTLGKVSVKKVGLGDVGDDAVTYRMSIPVTASGVKVDTTLDFAFVRVGRAALFVTGTRFSFGEMSPKEFAGIVAKASKRLDRTLAGAK